MNAVHLAHCVSPRCPNTFIAKDGERPACADCNKTVTWDAKPDHLGRIAGRNRRGQAVERRAADTGPRSALQGGQLNLGRTVYFNTTDTYR